MRLESLRSNYIGTLNDAAQKFQEPDLDRHLGLAARDLSRVAPLVKRGTLTLVADQDAYTAPADIVAALSPVWGVKEKQTTNPWEDTYPGRLPRLSLEAGQLYLTPAPTTAQISLLGSSYAYRYSATYVIGDTDAGTNIPDRLQDALLIRAAAQAMQELAHRGITKPVALGGSGNSQSMPRNGHPAALAQDLLKLFEDMTR